MHPARRGPYNECGQGFGAGVVEQDVHRKFGAGLDAVSFRIGSGAEVSERHGEVQRLQVFQSLVSGSPVGKCELAEGGHYEILNAASCSKLTQAVSPLSAIKSAPSLVWCITVIAL